MSEAPVVSESMSVDLGQALASLLRRYLDTARESVAAVPGGARGFQVMSIASTLTCSNQATIASTLGLDRTVMTYLVDDLEEAGLVERRPDPADRRARQVLLTDEGRGAFAEASERIREVERAVLGDLDDAEVELFRSLLTRVTTDTPSDFSACEGTDC